MIPFIYIFLYTSPAKSETRNAYLYSSLFPQYTSVNSSENSTNPPSFRPKEASVDSETINQEHIVTTSRKIDIDDEISAISRKTYKNSPKAESIRLTHDLASEIERLRNAELGDMAKPPVEPELNYKDGIHIKKPMSETDLNLRIIDDYLLIYINPLAYLPTTGLFLISLPSFSYYLVYGRDVSKYSIPAITGFVTYFLTYNALRSVYILAVIMAVIVSVFSYSIALKPVNYFKLGPKKIRKEPVGWIFVILFSCAILSNLVYKVLYIVTQSLFGSISLARFVRALIPGFYLLFILSLSGVILTMLIVAVPTRYAQNSVFSLSCSYILFSGVSYINDLLAYNFSGRMKPIQFDLTQFFDSSVVVSVSQILMILGTLLTAVGTTYLNSPK